jgi:Bacterial cadherin-like domain
MRKAVYFLGAAASAVALGGAGRASETQTYSYDALGRLVSVQYSGSVNNNQAHSLCYDPAGNRTLYKSSSAGSLATCGGGPPPPPPPPPNQPPVANPNSITAPKCVYRSVNVISNDTDPDGHYPLALTAVNQPWAWVESSTNVGMQTPETNGTYYITYTVADSLGATANGTLTVTVSGAQQCF